eukprot:gene5958-9957_t
MFTKHFLFILLNLTLFLFTFSKTSFPTLQRKFYFGGEFNEVFFYNKTSSTIEKKIVHNIASFDGISGIWQKVGNKGTDGRVNEIYVDTCSNVFIGGEFTSVDDLQTGPIAKFEIKTKSWKTIHTKTMKGPTYSRGSYVNTIIVDCFNKPTTIECPCDVYFGGKFSATISPQESVSGKTELATNILKYNYYEGKYDNLGGHEIHNLDIPSTAEVKKIYKKQIGVFQNTLNYLWVGGSFSSAFTKYHVYNEKWGFTGQKFNFQTDSSVEDMYYSKGQILDPDLIYIGGKFTVNLEQQQICSNLCVFNYATEKITQISTNPPNGCIYSMDYLDSTRTLIIGGSFTNYGLSKIRSIVNPSTHSKFIDYVQNDNQIKYDVRTISVCESRFCGFGSFAYASGNAVNQEEVKFWSSEKREFFNFGNGTNGVVNVIKGDYSNAHRFQFSFVIILVSFCLLL